MKKAVTILVLLGTLISGLFFFADLGVTWAQGPQPGPVSITVNPYKIMDLWIQGGQFLTTIEPELFTGHQATGFCSGGGTTATLDIAQTLFTPCEYPVGTINPDTSITLTTLASSNVATINILWQDGTTATAVAPPAVGGSTTLATTGKTTSLAGFTLVVTSSAALAANTTYSFQGTFATGGN